MSKTICYKAQWPLSSSGEPQVLIYEEDKFRPKTQRSQMFYLPATPEVREQLFEGGKFLRVYFLGNIKGGMVNVDRFVRKDEWL